MKSHPYCMYVITQQSISGMLGGWPMGLLDTILLLCKPQHSYISSISWSHGENNTGTIDKKYKLYMEIYFNVTLMILMSS